MHTCRCTVTIETPTGTGITRTIDNQYVIEVKSEQKQYIGDIHHHRSFVLAVLTFCHAPGYSCSRQIPCEDRALTIRGFPRPAARREGCKVFWGNRPTQGPSGPTPSSPRVELESSPLPRHRSTFSASSEDLARPVWRGVVTTD